jgi:putative inorganic carbon (hco3(-)) transporter
MRDSLIVWSDRIIRFGIYTIFFLVPLIFTNNTSELFELNKMWLTWEVTLFIACAWFIKMLLQRRILIQRTPLDIPLLLFLLSQIIATIFSLDPHTSFWGYYSRFNGGLLSMITYIFLYYAVVTNLKREHIMTVLRVSLVSGLLVALWGLPSHFGKDPTCLLFQGSFDVSCWTDAFKPTVRIFSTLGQPAWMAAYLNILLPITLVYILIHAAPMKAKNMMNALTGKEGLLLTCYVLLTGLFYVCLIFTNTRAGTIGFWIANLCFWGVLFSKKYLPIRKLLIFALICNGMFLGLNFIYGTSFTQLDRFTLPSLTAHANPAVNTQAVSTTPSPSSAPAPAGSFEGTDSGKIRQIVWKGALDIWKAYPVFGSGVETFAFAYYRYRPASHNMTSEWDYLYNKAHNEYLNYLATTGIFGLGTYLTFIALFLFIMFRYGMNEKHIDRDRLLILALVVGFISILITNFFAFSVVIINLYLFLIPAFIFLLAPKLLPDKRILYPKQTVEQKTADLTAIQWTGVTILSLGATFLLLLLIRFWYADTAYALGSNLNHVQEFQQSYLKLGEAVQLRPSEPTFKDEFATNNAMIAVLLLLQEGASNSAEAKQQSDALSQQAISLSNEVVTKHPNNISFWKNRVRMFYALAQADNRYLPYALDAVEHVSALAPTDAKVQYNLGALYRENKNPRKSAEVLENVIRLKPDYRDAYYALGIAYNDLAVDGGNRVIHPEMREKAISELQYILEHISPDDKEVKQTLTAWNAQ